MAKITNYSLGSQGVMLDPHHLLPGVSPEGMTLAQNFFHDQNAGFGGALRKRPGFAKFNSLWAGAAILGGIGMPVAGTAGAPAAGGGTGFPGTGNPADDPSDGTGLPGATFDGAAGPTFLPPSVGAATFAAPGTFGGARLIVVGRGNNAGASGSDGGIGWYVSSKGLADVAVAVTTPGPPGALVAYPPTTKFAGSNGSPSVYHAASGYLFYAAGHDQPSGTATPIRKVNGATDSLVATVPLSPDDAGYNNGSMATGANRQHVSSMHLGYDGFIYFTLKDRAGGQNVLDLNYGRVYRMNVSSGALSEAPALTKAVLPYCCAFFNGKLFWGIFNLSNSEVAVPPANITATIYSTNDAFDATLLDLSLTIGSPPTGNSVGVTTSLYTFPSTGEDQILFAGFGVNGNGTDYPGVYTRFRGPSGTGLWSLTLTGSGGASAVHGTCFPSMVEFNGKLYVSFFDPGQIAKIYEFTPNYADIYPLDGHWAGGGTWATVYTNTGTIRPYTLFVDDGVIYGIGQLGFGAATSAVVSTDGTTWTDKSASLPAFGNQSYPLPILAGFNQ